MIPAANSATRYRVSVRPARLPPTIVARLPASGSRSPINVDAELDTELLVTFLELNRTRHFGRAAANLYLTQSAVSSRMRMLEQSIGMPLLTRSRNDIQLTPAGRKLLPHAEAIVERWVRAKHEVMLHEEERAALNIATVLPVSDLLFGSWIRQIWDSFPDLGLSIDILPDQSITERLQARSVDLAVTFDPPSDPDLKIDRLQPLTLNLLSTKEGSRVADSMNENYVLVDWGEWFQSAHARHFPHYVPGGLRVRSPNLAFHLLKSRDGAGYLPVRLGGAQTDQLDLFPVADAPVIEHATFAVYPKDLPNRGLVEDVLGLLDSG